MIQEIFVVPRKVVETWAKSLAIPGIVGDWALISIYGDTPILVFNIPDKLKQLGCKYMIDLKFDDVTPESPGVLSGGKFKVFDDTQAYHIINFINEIKNKVNTLIIHCAAGVSRSGAVGVWACRYLKLDETIFRNTNSEIFPNQHVLNLLTQLSGMNDNYVEFWKTKPVKAEEIF